MATTSIVRRQTDQIRGCLAKIGGILGTAFSAYALVSLGRKCIEVSSNLTEVQNVVDVTFGNMAYKVEEFAQTSIEKFGMSELTLKKTASQFQAMGTAMNISSESMSKATEYLNKQTNGYVELSDSMADVSLTLTKLTADMSSFHNREQDAVAQDLRSIITGMVVPMYDYGIDLTETSLKQWALKEGLDANIESMTQAEKAMLRYQYVLTHTKAAHGDFERTANSWANQTRILKQNFEELGQVIGDSLIAALKPFVKALNEAMAHVIKFARVLSDSLGKIFGWEFDTGGGGITSDMEGASDAAGGIGDGISDATDKAKKLKQQLQGFDELNVISSDKDKDSGSGGGGSDSGSSGEWVEADSIMDGYESKLDSLFKLGEHIGKTITDSLNSIDWDSVYEGARSFGKGLAEFLNGLISPELFAAVGQTIAGSLNAAVYQALAFAEEFDWIDFGKSLAAGVNKFFETFDFIALAESINAWIKGAIATATTFLKETDFELIGKKIGEFLVALDFTEILGDFAELIWEAIKAGFELISGMFEEAPLETALLGAFAILKFTKLGAFISSKIVAALAAKLGLTGTFSSVGSVVITALSTALTTALASFGGIIGLLNANIATVIGATSTLAEIGLVIGTGIIGGVTAALGGWHFGQFLYEFLTKETIEMSWKEQFSEIFKSITDGIWIDAFAQWGKDILNGFKEMLLKIFNWSATSEMFEHAKATMEKGGLYIVQGILEGFVGSIMLFTEPIADLFSFVWDMICMVFGIHSPAEQMKPLGDNILRGIIEGFTSAVSDFTTAISDWFDESVTPWFTIEKWTDLLSNVLSAFNNIFDNINNFVSQAFDGLSGIVNGFISTVINCINKIKELIGLQNQVNKNSLAGGGLGGAIGGIVGNNSKVAIPQFATGGFPEDGLFMANRNELVGKFSNGKTAVANNEQITKGIADAVYPAIYNAVSAAMRNSSNGSSSASPAIKVFVGDRELTDIAIEGINERIRTTGRIPIHI